MEAKVYIYTTQSNCHVTDSVTRYKALFGALFGCWILYLNIPPHVGGDEEMKKHPT